MCACVRAFIYIYIYIYMYVCMYVCERVRERQTEIMEVKKYKINNRPIFNCFIIARFANY